MSILRFLLLMLLSIITLVSFTATLAGYRSSVSKAEELFDQNLANFAAALNVFTFAQERGPSAQLGSAESQGVAFQVWQHGVLISNSSNAPSTLITPLDSGYGETNFSGQRWRTYSWEEHDRSRRIIVAEPLSSRIELAESVALASLSPLVFSTPLLALFIALTISRGLAPLKKLSQLLRLRRANDFSPVYLDNSPAELRPVVSTINRLLKKVQAAFEREKRFSSDAAHELRTPISVLQVGIHNLSEKYPEAKDDINNLHQGVQRMSHVVEQILQLNRTHPDHFKAKFQSLSLVELCQKSIAQCFESIDAKEQTIELDHQPAIVFGDPFSLSIMLENLILNANKYTPAGGEILIRCETVAGRPTLTIEDSGPGIAQQDYGRVLDRFYRSGGDQHASDISGCGLGMAIVKQVVDLHSAEIELASSVQLGGLKVTIVFPHGEDPAR